MVPTNLQFDDQLRLNMWRLFLIDTYAPPYDYPNGKSTINWDRVYQNAF